MEIAAAGSDVANLQTTATMSADGKSFVVNGNKKWISNALWSDFCIAAVRTGSENSGAAGVSALIIPLDAPGVTRRRIHCSGMTASGTTFVEFDDVLVPRENLLGGEAGLGKGFKMIMSSM
jgi:alkylation response protein AidB-like acyl-CoA dehydrogenase